MTVCRFFQRGYCKFGNNCRFEHIGGTDSSSQQYYSGNYRNYDQGNYGYGYSQRNTPSSTGHSSYGFSTSNRFGALGGNYGGNSTDSQATSRHNLNASHGSVQASRANAPTLNEFVTSVCQEVDASEKGKQWPISCYGPLKNGSNYPGLDDMSPEELRFEAYQCQQQNNLNRYITDVQQLCNNQTALYREIKSRSPNAVNILTKIFQGQKVESPTTNVFASSRNLSAADPRNFSFSLPSASPSFSPPQAGVSPSFGMPSTAASSFGMAAVSSPPAPSAFGMSSTFGSPSLGASPILRPAPPVEQQQASNTAWPSSQPFGFNQQANAFSSSANNDFTNTSFASSPAQPSSTSFETVPPSYQAPEAAVSAPFGQSPSPGTMFTAGITAGIPHQASENTVDVYTPMSSLTDEEREQFTAECFTVGKIPVRPPPKEFCF